MAVRWLIFFTLCVSAQVFSLSNPPSKPTHWDNWTFGQKISWRRVNLDPRIPYGPLVDKVLVKKLVRDEMRTARSLFATNDPSQIFLEKLPSTFIMKSNNASGRGILVKNGMVIATRKREADFIPRKNTNEFLRSYAHQWLTHLYAKNHEKQYGLVKPMILFEEYLEDLTMEIEVFFFNGKARLITLFFIEGYTKNPVVSYYDENWNLFDTSDPSFYGENLNLFDTARPGFSVKNEPIEKPPYIDKMIAFGERLADKIDHVRIDFFVSKKNIYFGEFTFTTGGGYSLDHLNLMIGSYWDFPDPNDSLVNPYLNNLLRRANCLLNE